MGVNKQHEMMQEAFLESKDIINQIFRSMKAPDDWQINHMTFDELVAALYKILGIWNGEYRDDVNVTPDTLLQDVTAYDRSLSKIVGNIPSIQEYIYTPGTEDQVIIEGKTYVAGDQIIAGCPDLKPENIRKDVSVFGVVGTLEEGSGTVLPQRDPSTATNEDIIQPLFAYDEQLNKINGSLKDKRNKVTDGNPTRKDSDDLYVSPTYKAVYNNNSELSVPLKAIGRLLDIDPSKIESGYEILGIKGTKPIPNEDTNGDGEPDINIPVSEEEAEWIDKDHVREENKNDPVYLNADTDNDKIPNINIDTNNDGKPELNIDTDKDGKPDVNIDIDGDGIPELNIDTDGDYKPDIDIDLNRDGLPDTNVDTNNDGEPDLNVQDELENDNLNIDTNDDGIPDLNIDNNNDQFPDVNIDIDNDGIPDLNIDTNGDGIPDLNIDTNNDGIPDLNIDDDGDGIPDRNVDTNGDGIPDVNIDTNHDGKPDTNIDTNHDGIPDKEEKGKPRDPDEDIYADHDTESKDKRMEITPEDIEDSKVNPDEIGEDHFDEDDHDEDNNPNFNEDGDQAKDEDHSDLIEIKDEEGKKQYVPNPALQWAYSDYYLPMIYPTTQIHRPEKYAVPVELTKDQDKIYSVINDCFLHFGQMTFDHAITYPWEDDWFYWENEPDVIYRDDELKQIFLDYDVASIRNEFDLEIVKNKANGMSVWVKSVSNISSNAWGDSSAATGPIYLGSDGKLYHGSNSDLHATIFEKKYTRIQKTVTTTVPIGQKTTIQSNEINAAMIPFVRYAITQETRAKMYHYGNDTYLDTSALSDNVTQELPKLKMQATGSVDNMLPPKGVYSTYMDQWKNPQGMPDAVYPDDYVTDAYTTKDGHAIEKPDYVYFQHNNYIEDAMKLYKRLGKVFEKNGDVNSFTYPKLGGGTVREAPTANIQGESVLQVYVADLRMTENECYYIWRAAFHDYADYLPVFCMPMFSTIFIDDTVNEYQTVVEQKTILADMNEIEILNAPFSAEGKEILRFTPAASENNTTLTVTMNTRHWEGFTLYRHTGHTKLVAGSIKSTHNHYKDDYGNPCEFEPFSISIHNVDFEAGVTYSIVTKECNRGGEELGKFVYTFSITDVYGQPTSLKVEYTIDERTRKEVPHQIRREIVEHMYLAYYPEDFRQECFQDIEDTFQDLTQYVEQYVGVKYKEHHVGNIFERGATYTPEEKKKIAKCIHDYLVINNAYAYGDEMNQTIYPAMSRGKRHPVCTSYATAFKYCCSRYGIVCHITLGVCDPNGEHTDEYGGNHMWNRINYESFSFTEKQYLHNDGKIVSSDKPVSDVISNLVDKYDQDNRSNYTANKSGNTDKFFFKDSSFEGNNVKVTFIQSHRQYDKNSWSDVDVTWDDPSEPGTDTLGNTDNICWDFFNVSSNVMKQKDSGERIYTKIYMTDTGIQCYANLVGQDSHQDQLISGKTDRYNGSTIYGW